MRGNRAIRLCLCGIVAGVAWYLLNAVFLLLFARDLLAVAETGGPHSRWDGRLLFVVDLIMGVWALWLYSTVRPRYRATVMAAGVAGVAWWAIKTLQSAKWVALGFVPAEVVLVPLATTLIAAVVATMAGAWVFDGGWSFQHRGAPRPDGQE